MLKHLTVNLRMGMEVKLHALFDDFDRFSQGKSPRNFR
jgi:hypothetical protein